MCNKNDLEHITVSTGFHQRSRCLQKPVYSSNCLLTMEHVDMQGLSFWRPSAWADALCAHQSSTRKQASWHVLAAGALALGSWALAAPCVVWYMWMVAFHNEKATSDLSLGFPGSKIAIAIVINGSLEAAALLILIFLVAAPIRYLSGKRYGNMKPGSLEARMLMQDACTAQEACETLVHFVQQSSVWSERGPAPLPSCRSTQCTEHAPQDVSRKHLHASGFKGVTAPAAGTHSSVQRSALHNSSKRIACSTSKSKNVRQRAQAAAAAAQHISTCLTVRMEDFVFKSTGASIRGYAAAITAIEL